MTTGVLCPVPILQFFSNDGNPAVGGSVLTQIGGSNAATYQDVGLTTPLPNPIPLNSRGEVSTSFGASAQCFLTPNQVYTFTLFDANGNQLWVATYVNGVQVDLTQASLGAILWPYDARFDGAPVVDTGWIYGDPRRFGAIGDNATDDTVALNAWASGGGSLILPDLTFLITDAITLVSDTHIIGCDGSTVHQSVADKSIFTNTNGSNIDIEAVHFLQSTWGAGVRIAPVVFNGTAHGTVTGCEIEGHQWAGVYMSAARHCTARGNYFHDSFPLQSVTLTTPPVATATSGTLTAPWALPTGGYTVAFTETSGGAGEGRQVTLTLGDTTATWISGLGANCDAAIVIQPATDSGDVVINSSASAGANYNVVDGNFCYGNTLETGVQILDPYNGVLPTRNVVSNNRITAHIGYGIICYMPNTGDSYNQIIGNFVENITGSFALNNSSGAGIYVTGAGIGGTVISGNTIRNCCINTANATLAPAAIGIAGGGATGGAPLAITGNTVTDMTQYHGILLTGVGCTGAVTGNSIRMPAANITGHGITITNCIGITATGNTVYILNTTTSQRGILVQSLQNIACTDIALIGNNVKGGHYAQIEFTASGGAVVTGFTVSGNTLSGGDASCVCFQVGGACTDGTVTGNWMTAPTANVINQSSALRIRYSNNQIQGSGLVSFTSTNTGTYFDRTNGGLTDANITNSGTGCIVVWTNTGNLDVAAGVHAVGDIVWRSDAVSGQRIFSVCTNATGSGTWKVVNLT